MAHRNMVLSAITFGIAVHFRIFPAFFALSFFFLLSKRQFFLYGFVSFFTFFVLTLVCFALYGQPFIEETYLYHLQRIDYKHNFAAPWLPNYIGFSPNKIWNICRLILIIALSYKAKYTEYTWTTICIVFIGYNTVCTVQYFDWFFCLLAIIPDVLLDKKVIIALVMWALSHVIWLLFAYKLEFEGQDVFYPLWSISILIFICTNYLIFTLLNYPNLDHLNKIDEECQNKAKSKTDKLSKSKHYNKTTKKDNSKKD